MDRVKINHEEFDTTTGGLKKGGVTIVQIPKDCSYTEYEIGEALLFDVPFKNVIFLKAPEKFKSDREFAQALTEYRKIEDGKSEYALYVIDGFMRSIIQSCPKGKKIYAFSNLSHVVPHGTDHAYFALRSILNALNTFAIEQKAAVVFFLVSDERHNEPHLLTVHVHDNGFSLNTADTAIEF